MPDDPRRRRPDRAPGEGEELELIPIGHRDHAKHLSGTHLERPVTEREHIGEAKRREKVDIGGPGPDPLDAEKGVPRLGEWHVGQGIEIEVATGHRAAQLEEVGGLLPCDTDAAKIRLGGRCDRLGCDRPQQPVKSPVHGRPRFEGDLLLHDQPDQGGESGGPRPERRRPMLLDDRGEHRLLGDEQIDSFAKSGLVEVGDHRPERGDWHRAEAA